MRCVELGRDAKWGGGRWGGGWGVGLQEGLVYGQWGEGVVVRS